MHSYLVFFSMLGTLARLGLQAITIYPGAPVALGEIWANVAGTLVMGYLAEDRVLFQRDLAPATQQMQKRHDGSSSASSSSPSSSSNNNNNNNNNNKDAEHAAQLKKEHMTIKKSIPAYIGLTVGFCGSLTTFSSFMRDAFLALSNDLNTAPTSSSSTETLSSPRSRNAGYSVEALLAVLILEVAAGLAALSFGAHAALYSERIVVARPVAPKKKNEKKKKTTTTRSVLDPLVAVLAWPMWLGAVLMAIWPPHGHGAWRGQAVFALVFAPAGQLGIATPRPPNTVRNTPSQHSAARVQRRRLPRPSPNLDGIDTRLERLETLLERVIHASSSRPPTLEESQSSSHVSLRATPEQPSPAASSAEPIRAEKDDDGTLLVAKGGSQFVSSHHWSLLATELQDIREILSTDKEPSTPDVFAVPTGHVTQFLPADAAACYDLLRIFYLYVDPITRLVHKPSLDRRFALFIQEYVNPRWLATNGSEEHLEEKLNHDGLLQFRPLAFAIFYAAAHSQAVACGYAEDKRRLTATYRKGLELSLLAADFCSSSSLEVLQAYVLLLSCQLRDVTIGRTWPLLGVATRLAISQGLHREPTLFRPVPDEVAVEQRRRIWHQLCYLEWRAAELKGVAPGVLDAEQPDDALTTRVPKNVNDSELSAACHPGLLDDRCGVMESEEGRFTEMTFLQDELVADFEAFHRQTTTLLEGVRERISACFRPFEQHDDRPMTALQKLCLMTSRSMEWKCWLTFWCGVPKDFRKKVMSDEARRRVLDESVSLLENLNAITADPGVQGFKWFLEAHSAFQCIFLVLSELRELREKDGDGDGALRERAVAALRHIVALHDQGAESRPWAVVGNQAVGADQQQGGFDPFGTPSLPQPFATEEELLQFTFPPGTEWADPMQDFGLWHLQ
ncbi:putative c6 transcription factor [Diplodia seriata]|uniref:Putative c6 transcription factor n=1 Tax=Diplodia seriata TaxID=420778 RepID=A0A0G2F0Q9_9PEZI|nr:putative c6 transcription factor [Diplodia seriata]